MVLVLYGDSISTTEYGGGYASQLQEAVGFTQVYNYSVSATCLADVMPQSGIEIIRKEENRHSDADVVILWHGTNDWYWGNPLGSVDSADEKTFYGALNAAISLIKRSCPNAKILLPTALLRYQNPDGSEETGEALETPNKVGLTHRAYIQAVKTAGARQCCTVLDMRQATGFTLDEIDRYLGDKVHPSPEGYQVITGIFTEAIQKMLSEN